MKRNNLKKITLKELYLVILDNLNFPDLYFYIAKPLHCIEIGFIGNRSVFSDVLFNVLSKICSRYNASFYVALGNNGLPVINVYFENPDID